MKLAQVLDVLRSIAPERLAEPWDAAGLAMGEADQRVRRAILCIDLTEPVLDEALKQKADLVVAYHPPIFKPLPALTDADVKQRIILRAARAGLAIYSPHTALDAVAGGVNDWLAAGVGSGAVRAIRAAEGGGAAGVAAGGAGEIRTCAALQSGLGGQVFKLVVFVPEDVADRLRARLSEAGAGVIGHYSECSFNLQGEGTFRGDETTSPAVGAAERFERVPELRMEMVVPGDRLREAVGTLRAEHPYEEPAFDIYPLHNPEPCGDTSQREGQGRVVELARPVKLATLVGRLKRWLGVKYLDVADGSGGAAVRTVGLCAGAGGSLLAEAGDVDVFFTGEMRHHDVLAAVADGTSIILAGHTQTERPYLPTYRDRLSAAADTVDWQISKLDRPPSAIR